MNGKRIEGIGLLVIGAGPAGLGAAVEASQRGIKVLVVDDQSRPGGQLIKQIHKFFGSREHRAGVRGIRIGEELLKEASALGVEILLSTKAVGIEKDLTVSLLHRDREMLFCRPERLLLATGGSEKPLTFPGSTLPGVLTAGAAQTLSNIDRVLPGENIVMVGSGNVGLIVAYQMLQAGARVAAVVEADRKVRGYEVHAAKIRRAGVPIYTGCTVLRARGKEHVEAVDIVAVDECWNPVEGSEFSIAADTVCIAVGLSPNAKLARMCGCEVEYRPELGGFLPRADENLELSRKGLYAAGDLTGIEEASIALDEGRLVGVHAAVSLGVISPEEAAGPMELYRSRLDALRADLIDTGENDETAGGECEEAVPSAADSVPYGLKNSPGYPADEFLKKKKIVVIECPQEIPCNPCTAACPFGAIVIESGLTGLPRLLADRCTGCGLCIAACPGLAIFLADYNYSDTKAALSFPYEYLPLPEEGDIVPGVDRNGETVADVEVVKVDFKMKNDKTAVVTVVMDKEYIHRIRSIRMGEEADG